MNLLRNTPNILKANFTFQELFHFWWWNKLQHYHMRHTAPRAISAENHMTKKSPVLGSYASSDRGRKTRTALLEKGVRNEANAAMNSFLLRLKNSKTQRSYDKMLIDWVRSGRTWRYLNLLSVWTHVPRCATVGLYVQTSSQIFPRPALPLSQ